MQMNVFCIQLLTLIVCVWAVKQLIQMPACRTAMHSIAQYLFFPGAIQMQHQRQLTSYTLCPSADVTPISQRCEVFQFSLQQFQVNLTCSHLSLMTQMQSSYKTFSICTMQRQTVQYLMRELNTGKLNVTFIRNRWGLCLNLRQSLRQLGVMRWELIRSELCSLTNSPIWCESWWAQWEVCQKAHKDVTLRYH